MGVLDRQSLRGDVRNRKLGRERLALRDRRRQGRPGTQERRRPDRGLRDAPRRRTPQRPNPIARGLERAVDAVRILGQLLVFLLAAPVLVLRALATPRELATRLKEAPSRVRAARRRFELESRDPESVPGRLVEATRLAAWFVREELADMRDGIPTADGLRRDVQGGATTAWDTTARFIGLEADAQGTPVGQRLHEAVALGIVLAVVALGLFLAGFQSIEELKTSDQLALRTIHVDGLVRVAEADVLAHLGADLGDNLLELGQVPLGVDVVDLPWVESVDVVRDLGDRSITVQIREHRPALLLPGTPLRLVDDRGVAFKDWEPGEPFDLPLLTGVTAEADLAAAADGAIDVLNALRGGRVLDTGSVSEIRWDAEDGYAVVTRAGLPVRLGRRDFAARLDRVERAVGAGRLPLDALASVDAGLRDRLVAVPRTHKKARTAVRRVLESQPVPTRDRARLLHLERIQMDMGESLFGSDG